MTWSDDLWHQIRNEFREAQRRRGELDTSEDTEDEGLPRAALTAPAITLDQPKPGRRRLVTRRTP